MLQNGSNIDTRIDISELYKSSQAVLVQCNCTNAIENLLADTVTSNMDECQGIFEECVLDAEEAAASLIAGWGRSFCKFPMLLICCCLLWWCKSFYSMGGILILKWAVKRAIG